MDNIAVAVAADAVVVVVVAADCHGQYWLVEQRVEAQEARFAASNIAGGAVDVAGQQELLKHHPLWVEEERHMEQRPCTD